MSTRMSTSTLVYPPRILLSPVIVRNLEAAISAGGRARGGRCAVSRGPARLSGYANRAKGGQMVSPYRCLTFFGGW
jgi:hypothetical protein